MTEVIAAALTHADLDSMARKILAGAIVSEAPASGRGAADFDAALTAAGHAPELLASIPGLNYVRGDVLDVKLYRLRN